MVGIVQDITVLHATPRLNNVVLTQNVQVVRTLLAYGIDLNVWDSACTPLYEAEIARSDSANLTELQSGINYGAGRLVQMLADDEREV